MAVKDTNTFAKACGIVIQYPNTFQLMKEIALEKKWEKINQDKFNEILLKMCNKSG